MDASPRLQLHEDGIRWLQLKCDDHRLWCKLAHANIPALANTDYVNVGIPGGSNSEIFEAALGQINDDVAHLIVQWTSFPRVNVKVGLEWWNPNTKMWQGGWDDDMRLSDRFYTRDYVEKVLDRFMDLQHPHWSIVDILRYSQILEKMCAKFGIKLTLVNGHCPWDENYFNKDDLRHWKQWTLYTQEVIAPVKRAPEDIQRMYDKIHEDYSILNPTLWVSLDRAFTQMKTDVNGDGMHPGEDSNRLYAQLLTWHMATCVKNRIKVPDDKYSKGT